MHCYPREEICSCLETERIDIRSMLANEYDVAITKQNRDGVIHHAWIEEEGKQVE